jgi:calcineurin-like phosphoesterase family protein
MNMGDTYIIGDIHGHRERMVALLTDAGLVDSNLKWVGGASTLWHIGDFFDRGPDAVGAVDLFMRWQREAAVAGGHVRSLLGNHDALILSAYRFGEQKAGGPGGTFMDDWIANGGREMDLRRLGDEHIQWLTALPAMAEIDDTLLMHADSMLYTHYGSKVEDINGHIRRILRGSSTSEWDRLLEKFNEHGLFYQMDRAALRDFLHHFGVRRVIHGHTPISKMTGLSPTEVKEALVYAEGRCINVDGGIYRGGPGFVYQLKE